MAYVHLPHDDELVALWEANGRSFTATAEVIGCSASAVGLRLRKLGLRSIRPSGREGPVWQVTQTVEGLSALVANLLERVQALESRPVPVRGGLVEWRPDHRRQADGGRPVRAQRKAVGLPKRPKAVA